MDLFTGPRVIDGDGPEPSRVFEEVDFSSDNHHWEWLDYRSSFPSEMVGDMSHVSVGLRDTSLVLTEGSPNVCVYDEGGFFDPRQLGRHIRVLVYIDGTNVGGADVCVNNLAGTQGFDVPHAVYGEPGERTLQVRVTFRGSGDVIGSYDAPIVIEGEPDEPPQALNAEFVWSPTNPDIGDMVTFDATPSSGPIISYTWDFHDGSAWATGQTVQHTYDEPGEYEVVMQVEDALGNTDAVAHVVSVGCEPDECPVGYEWNAERCACVPPDEDPWWDPDFDVPFITDIDEDAIEIPVVGPYDYPPGRWVDDDPDRDLSQGEYIRETFTIRTRAGLSAKWATAKFIERWQWVQTEINNRLPGSEEISITQIMHERVSAEEYRVELDYHVDHASPISPIVVHLLLVVLAFLMFAVAVRLMLDGVRRLAETEGGVPILLGMLGLGGYVAYKHYADD